MPELTPWLAVAGAGALHGLNPAGGWLLASGCLLRQGARGQHPGLRQMLAPMALGHLVALALVAAIVAWDPSTARLPWPMLALLVLPAAAALAVAIARRRRGAGLALGSFIGATLQGAGLMLVPALMPLCIADDGPARALTASGSWGLVGAAVVVHAAAMLGTTGLLARGTSWAAQGLRAHRPATGRRVTAIILGMRDKAQRHGT